MTVRTRTIKKNREVRQVGPPVEIYGQKLGTHVEIYVSEPEKKLKKPRYSWVRTTCVWVGTGQKFSVEYTGGTLSTYVQIHLFC